MLTWVSRSRFLASCNVSQLSPFHTSSAVERSRNWEMKNRIVYPPQTPEEPRRPATLSGISSDGFGEHRNTVLKNKTYDRYTTEVEIFHCRKQIKYSKDKMWYLAKMIRGMSIDQAIAQLEFNDKKGAKIMREVLLEAQDLAVRNHNVEYKSNLYIGQGFIASVQDVKVLGVRAGNGSRSKVHRITIYRSVQGITIQKCARMSDDPTQSFSNKGKYLKRIRYHGRGMFGIMDRVYCHYYVKLVEGPPPPPEPAVTGFDQAKKYVQQLRDRTIIHGL